MPAVVFLRPDDAPARLAELGIDVGALPDAPAILGGRRRSGAAALVVLARDRAQAEAAARAIGRASGWPRDALGAEKIREAARP
jgi:hypothetical protein